MCSGAMYETVFEHVADGTFASTSQETEIYLLAKSNSGVK